MLIKVRRGENLQQDKNGDRLVGLYNLKYLASVNRCNEIDM